MSIRTFNGRWLLVNGALASSDSCCCNDPPPLGACCSEGFCYESTEADCFGSWQGAETTCSPNPCPPPEYPGACCVEGVCQEVGSEEECANLGGTYQGAYSTCEDGDCADTCCVAAENDDGCAITVCSPGYFASACDQPCFDPDGPNPPTAGLPGCQDGTALHNTVTFSGVTFNTGDPALDAILGAAMNTSYAITRDDCFGNNTAAGGLQISFPLSGGLTATVTFPSLIIRNASIVITDPGATPPLRAAMERNDGFRSSTTSACGGSLYDCDEGVSGPPTSTGGFGDYTNADITTS